MVYTIKFVVRKHIISSVCTKTVSSVISVIFDEINFGGSLHPFSIEDYRQKKKYVSNIFLKITFKPNSIKIDDWRFVPQSVKSEEYR